MKRWKIIGGILLLVVGLGFLFPPNFVPDLRPLTDGEVQMWMEESEQQDAIEFLEQGGRYADREYASQQLDEKVVMPLLQRLRDEVGQESIALLMEQNPRYASAMAVKLPSDEARRLQLQSIFIEADEAFSGIILRQYGHTWMHFEIADEAFAQASNLENWHVE